MIIYTGENIKYNGCPSCAFSNHEFCLPCGIIYEDNDLTISQDWELPIPAFLVISPKRHIECFNDLTKQERNKIFSLIDKIIKILKDNNICKYFNVIFEEKESIHFHIWIMPRHKFLINKFGNPTKNIQSIFEYAKNNMKINEIFKQINEICKLISNELRK